MNVEEISITQNNIDEWSRIWENVIGNDRVGDYGILEEFQEVWRYVENECELVLCAQLGPKRKKAAIHHAERLQSVVNNCENWPAFTDHLWTTAYTLFL